MPNENPDAQLARDLAPDLALLDAVQATHHVTRAAELLGVPQPTASRRLAALGRRLGAPVIEPDGRGIRLTRAGQLLAESAARALAVLENGARLAREEVEPARGHVVLGFLHLLGRALVPSLVASFREIHPHVRFSLVQGSRQKMLAQLKAGELDLALLAPLPSEPGFASAELVTQELVLSVPARHPLAKRTSVRAAELRKEKFVTLEPGYGLRQITDELCVAAGFSPEIAFEGQESDTVRGLVAAGLGVAVLPRFEPGAPAGVAEVPLAPPVTRTIGLAWLDGPQLTPAVRAFRQHVRGQPAQL